MMAAAGHRPAREPGATRTRPSEGGRTAVAVASGDTVVVDTVRGPVEARRMGRAEAGQSRWRIAFPWGDETFFGHSHQAAAHARKRAAAAGMPGAVGAEGHQSGPG